MPVSLVSKSMNNFDEIEQLIQSKNLNAPRSTPTQVESAIADTKYVLLPDRRSTLCAITLVNGFTVHGISSMVSGEDYDQEVGRITAYKKAFGEVRDVLAVLMVEKRYQEQQAQNIQALQGTGFYFKHHKGGIYKLLHIAKNESDLEEIAVYQAVLDGVIYTRPLSEFYEKFTCVVGMDDKELERINLQAEYDELLNRYSNLETKLGEGQPDDTNDNQWWLLKRQLATMRDYHEVLTVRIADLDQSA